jgi:hypothetical protein
METRYPFEWGDICGTSYGPYPFDEPILIPPGRGRWLLSWLGFDDPLTAGTR